MSWAEKVAIWCLLGAALPYLSLGLDYVGIHSFSRHWYPALRTEGLGGHLFHTETQSKEPETKGRLVTRA